MKRHVLVMLMMVLAVTATACASDDATTDDSSEGAAVETTDAPEDDVATEEEPAEEATEEEAATEDVTEDAAAEPTEDAPVARADADLVIWADETRVQALEPFVEQFGVDNGITVALQELEFDEIRSQFSTAAPAGEGPDIIVGAHDWLGELVTNGLVARSTLPTPGSTPRSPSTR